jgi:hypothetical protein
MNKFKEHVGNICGELKAAADANDMRLVHEVHAKLARAVDDGELPESAQDNGKSATSHKSGVRPHA